MPDTNNKDWEEEEQTIVSFAGTPASGARKDEPAGPQPEDDEATIVGERRPPEVDEDATVVAGRPRPGKIEAVAWLVITKTPSVRKGRIFTLERVRTEIGRGHDVDVFLNDPEVGRVHAAVRYEGPADGSGVFVLYDLASANGTFLNGEPVTAPTALKDGDRVALGGSELAFKRL